MFLVHPNVDVTLGRVSAGRVNNYDECRQQETTFGAIFYAGAFENKTIRGTTFSATTANSMSAVGRKGQLLETTCEV